MSPAPGGSRKARQRQREKQAQVRRAIVIVVVVTALAVLGVVIGVKALGGGSGTPQLPATGTVRVSMTEFAFSPKAIVLPHGSSARLEVINDGTTAHNLLIGELGKGTPNLEPGKTAVVDLSGQAAGTYKVICDLPGHAAAGMVGTLTLT